jgi:hypothetical protein
MGDSVGVGDRTVRVYGMAIRDVSVERDADATDSFAPRGQLG